MELLHLDEHNGHGCFFTDPTCCPAYDRALDALDVLDRGGYEVVQRADRQSCTPWCGVFDDVKGSTLYCSSACFERGLTGGSTPDPCPADRSAS